MNIQSIDVSDYVLKNKSVDVQTQSVGLLAAQIFIHPAHLAILDKSTLFANRQSRALCHCLEMKRSTKGVAGNVVFEEALIR